MSKESMSASEALGRLTHLWSIYRQADPKMAEALNVAMTALRQPLSAEELRTYMEAVKAAPAGKIAKGTPLESICPGCRTRNQLAEAALMGDPVEMINEICPVDDD